MNYKFFLFSLRYTNNGLISLQALCMVIFCGAFLTPFAMAQSLNREISGNMGGSVNSGDCGYIATAPNYVINLNQQNYSLHLRVEASRGKPTLLIVGPNRGDRTCILGDVGVGKLPQMGGVWAPGQYSIYVGESDGNQYPFTLKVIDR